MLRRAYIAKEHSTNIQKEIEDKFKFLRKYKRLGKRGVMRFQGVSKVRFLQSKTREMIYMMEKATFEIDIAIQKYADLVDIELTDHTKNINGVMMIFSLVAIAVMPPQVIGGIMGMNVLVPGQGIEDSLWPFYLVICIMLIGMIIIILIFKWKVIPSLTG